MNPVLSAEYMDFAATGLFSKLILDYLSGNEKLASFYDHKPDISSFENAISLKQQSPVNRDLLVNVLLSQYEHIPAEEKAEAMRSIKLLADEKTFTVTTGHQLCIFTGPLYFIYKIISTINLAEQLKKNYPQFHFVPVYWMAGEDHDFEEINHLHIFSKKITWQQDGKGATGHLSTSSLGSFFTELSEVLGESSNAAYLKDLFKAAYLNHQNLADATRYLVNRLFGKYRIVVLDADDAQLKKEFIGVMRDDLLHHSAFVKVNETCSKLEEYKLPVNPREINLFMLDRNSRERIVPAGDEKFEIKNTGQIYSREDLLKLLETEPEKFSPNVVLRPLYQERILPNLAYVGGPGEIGYWLEYKSMFGFYKTPFPVLMLRNCLVWVEREVTKRLADLNLEPAAFFSDTESLVMNFLTANDSINEASNLVEEKKKLHELFESVRTRALETDASLVNAVAAEQQKALNALEALSQKIIKAQKKKHEVSVNQIRNIRQKLFPENTPQERYYNFSMFYLKYGDLFLDTLKDKLDPFNRKFMIIREDELVKKVT